MPASVPPTVWPQRVCGVKGDKAETTSCVTTQPRGVLAVCTCSEVFCFAKASSYQNRHSASSFLPMLSS